MKCCLRDRGIASSRRTSWATAGLGVFAAEAACSGRWVCAYEGELITTAESSARYANSEPAYLLQLNEELLIDGERSTHHSRRFNHHDDGNLECVVDVERRRADFFTRRDVVAGEELSFDYGIGVLAESPPSLARKPRSE